MSPRPTGTEHGAAAPARSSTSCEQLAGVRCGERTIEVKISPSPPVSGPSSGARRLRPAVCPRPARAAPAPSAAPKTIAAVLERRRDRQDPIREILRCLTMPGMPPSPRSSIGRVTSRSTSSGVSPCAAVSAAPDYSSHPARHRSAGACTRTPPPARRSSSTPTPGAAAPPTRPPAPDRSAPSGTCMRASARASSATRIPARSPSPSCARAQRRGPRPSAASPALTRPPQ